MSGGKKILIIGEAMLDKTISVSEPFINNRSCVTHKITKLPEPTFGGVFFISRYLQHFKDVDITVLNISPTLTSKIVFDYGVFLDKFKTFPENGTLSECKTLEGSCDLIYSISRFMANSDQEIYFQIEDYYAPSPRKKNDKRYTYSTAKKQKLLNELKSKIDGWIEDNQEYDRRILLMDYDLGFFEEEVFLGELGVYFNKKNNTPVIIYSGKKYTKFNSFKNAHFVIYSKNDEGDFIEPEYFLENIKNQSCCFGSLVLVSAESTYIKVFTSTKKIDNMKPPIKIETDASGCNHGSQKHVPRTGHRAIIAAHLAMALTTNNNSLLNRSWIKEAHDNSKIITRKLLTENFVDKDWRKNIEIVENHGICKAVR
jgi:hypothetical protein